MKISHRGLLTGGGITCALAEAIKGTPGNPGAYEHIGKLVSFTANQGEVDLQGDGVVPTAVGVIIDVSPKGDSGTIETQGFEFVKTGGPVAVGSIATADGGVLVACATPNAPTAAELLAGCWVVAEVDAVEGRALINLSQRL